MNVQDFINECTRLTINMKVKLAVSTGLVPQEGNLHSARIDMFLSAQNELRQAIKELSEFCLSGIEDTRQV